MTEDIAATPSVEPLTAAEEAKFRESVAMLGDGGDYAPLQWANTTAIRLLATLDQAREDDLADYRKSLAEKVRALTWAITPDDDELLDGHYKHNDAIAEVLRLIEDQPERSET